MDSEDSSNVTYRKVNVLTEIKAAISVVIMLLANVVVVVYWAATLSTELKNLQTNVLDLKNISSSAYSKAQAELDFQRLRSEFKDHEDRLRQLEQKTFKY